MSEMDDIFDIEYFLKQKKAPKELWAAWKRFWRDYNALEQEAKEHRQLLSAYRTVRRILLTKSAVD